MRPIAMYIARALLTMCTLASFLPACASGGGGLTGNEEGSQPINESEANEYKKAIVRCYKTGGTRVVKIMGNLRCY
jgi:hypothetical protein